MPGMVKVLVLVVAAVTAWTLFGHAEQQPQHAPSAPQIAKSDSTPQPGPRIWYGADRYPRLSLPGGRQEIVRSVLNVKERMQFGGFVWNEDRIPQGPVWVRIDLGRQLLSVFRDGHEIGSAVILYGTDGKPTPTGSFSILEKAADHYSHSYDAPMPFMLRLTNDGVAIHGSNVRQGWATHGCIGIPLDFAKLLFAAAHKGDLVVILPPQSAPGKT